MSKSVRAALVGAAITLSLASRVEAQTVTMNAGVRVEQQLEMGAPSGISMGSIVTNGVAGEVTIGPGEGQFTVPPGFSVVGNPPNAAVLYLFGKPNAVVTITLPSSDLTLRSPGNTTSGIVLTSLQSNTAGGNLMLGADGNFILYIGGTFRIPAGLPVGTYTTTLNVNANYQ